LPWFQATANIPYINKRSEEILGFQKVRYNEDGIGDISLMGWFSLSHLFVPSLAGGEKDATPDEEGKEPEIDLSEAGDPSVFFGVGVKLDNGEFSARSRDKYNQDLLTAVAGEMKPEMGVIPATYQIGTGTVDALFALVYQQRFGRWVPNGGLTYQVTGGENDVEYEWSDKFGWSFGTKYILLQHEDCRQFYARAGIHGVLNLDPDKDHSQDITQVGDQEVGDVPGTEGTYNTWDLGLGYDITKNMTVIANYALPMGSHNQDSDNALDWQMSLSLQFKF
jgi:hypothetical protein